MSQNDSLPRPEYPRPDFQRDTWMNLNGTWKFRFDPDDVGVSEAWYAPESAAIAGQITVPYPWQSALSGVQDLLHHGVAWYRREVEIPQSWDGGRVVLHFGAVDYAAQVWVNGQLQGEHEGGYTPFEFDITPVLQAGENTIAVRVDDPANLWEIPHGKQKSIPPNPWDDVSFTTTSGIWQTVWLETRPASYIVSAHITPDLPNQSAVFDVILHVDDLTARQLDVALTAPDGTLLAPLNVDVSPAEAGAQTLHFVVPVESPLLWDILQPNLYEVVLRLKTPGDADDVVSTYFGMRSIETRGNEVLLNGRPIYLMSALDQGYWPDGLYTAPSDDALLADIDYALRLGLNSLRKHIKIEDPRFAYWADRRGLLLWNDTPSPVAFTELARARLERDLREMIDRDYNHPSIIVWSPYNESWGLEFRSDKRIQDYLISLYDQIKQWDPTRLVIDNSGWRHVVTDIADSHKYTDDPVEWRGFMTLLANDPMTIQVLGHPFFAGVYDYNGQPLMISEYGSGWRDDRSWSFKWQTNEIRRHPNVSGYTYTELYDIEHEYAGYALYDRTPKDFGYDPAMINSPDFVVLDYRQSPTITPGAALEVGVAVSAYGLPELHNGTLRWRLEAVTPNDIQPLAQGEQTVSLTPFTVTPVESIQLTVPEANGPVKLWVELLDADGHTRAQNYLDFQIAGESPSQVAQQTDGSTTTVTMTASLCDADGQFSPLGPLNTPRIPNSPACPILIGRDTGYIQFQFPLPSQDGAWQQVRFGTEIASLPPANFVTMALEGRGYPTDVQVSVNGVALGMWHVPDRPVNALGALTRINRLGVGEHGFWMQVETESQEVTAAVQAAAQRDGALTIRLEIPRDAEHRGGLTLFGALAGRYGQDPTITVTLVAD